LLPRRLVSGLLGRAAADSRIRRGAQVAAALGVGRARLPRAARADARHALDRVPRAHDPGGDAGRVVERFHPHRAGEGVGGAARRPAARHRTPPVKASLERRLATLLAQPPFNRASWGLYVVDDRGKVLFERNGDRFYVPASNTKLVVSAAATVLLPVDYRVKTSLYTNGRMDNGVLHGDLVLYGRGDPTWSERCFSVDSLAPGACDSAFTAIDAVADSRS